MIFADFSIIFLYTILLYLYEFTRQLQYQPICTSSSINIRYNITIFFRYNQTYLPVFTLSVARMNVDQVRLSV